jgi:RimJ/RimL family protein N-acetyltransferase
MQLKPLDSPTHLALAVGWLSRKEKLPVAGLRRRAAARQPRVAENRMQRGSYVLRLFTSDAGDVPIGVVGLSNVNPHFKTANIWVVLGERSFAGQGYASRATSQMLTLGFVELGLNAIHTWIVEHNPSIHVAKRVNFRAIGRQRQCHYIDGRAYDRLWFDLLASEHEEIQDARYHRTA